MRFQCDQIKSIGTELATLVRREQSSHLLALTPWVGAACPPALEGSFFLSILSVICSLKGPNRTENSVEITPEAETPVQSLHRRGQGEEAFLSRTQAKEERGAGLLGSSELRLSAHSAGGSAEGGEEGHPSGVQASGSCVLL